MQTGAASVENRMGFPQKIKHGTALGHGNCTSGNITKETQNSNSKEYMHPWVHGSITTAKIWRQPKYPLVDEQIEKLWHVHTVEYYLAVKRKEILLFVTAWVDLESFMLSEIRQSEKDKYHMISLTCGI